MALSTTFYSKITSVNRNSRDEIFLIGVEKKFAQLSKKQSQNKMTEITTNTLIVETTEIMEITQLTEIIENHRLHNNYRNHKHHLSYSLCALPVLYHFWHQQNNEPVTKYCQNLIKA